MKKILIVGTSTDSMGMTPRKTGVWLEELATPYYLWSKMGFLLVRASVKGGMIPVDPASLISDSPYVERCKQSHYAILQESRPLSLIDPEAFDAIFYPGGHGPLWDLAIDATNAEILQHFIERGKLIAAICHGPAAFGRNSQAFAGYRLTSFSNAEEQLAGLDRLVPFSVEDRLKSAGCSYSCETPWSEYVVCDRNLITGQNPQSSHALAEAVTQALIGASYAPAKLATSQSKVFSKTNEA